MWSFRQLNDLEELGDELGFLRYDLMSMAKSMFRDSWRDLTTQKGESRIIKAMDSVFVYPSASALLGDPSIERIPYMHENESILLPKPERLMDLLFLNFYQWEGHIIFRARNSKAQDRQVWMTVEADASLVSRLGICVRERMERKFDVSYVQHCDFSPERSCNNNYRPLASVLAGLKKPPAFADGNPCNLKPENLKPKKAGRPMKCAFCGTPTTKEASHIINKKRHCFECLGLALRRHGVSR